MQGVFLDVGSIDRGDLDLNRLIKLFPTWDIFDHTEEHQLNSRLKDADILITNKVQIGSSVMTQAKNLKLICVAATGTNNIDIAAAQSRNIKVCNVKGYATSSVVQHVFVLVLMLMTRMNDYQKQIQAGQWQKSRHFSMLNYPIAELAGKTMGIIGYGVLGKAVEKLALCFGMKVLIAAHTEKTNLEPKAIPLNGLLKKIDVLSLHCPLTDKTADLIGDKEFELMKNSAILINTARGGLVNEQALVKALKKGEIGGAGIDVLADEPPTDTHPFLCNPLPNLIVTPHIAWASRESRQRLIDGLCKNIATYLSGKSIIL